MFKYPFIFDILKRRRKGVDNRIPLHPPVPDKPPVPDGDKKKENTNKDGSEVDFNIDDQEASSIIFWDLKNGREYNEKRSR